MVRAAVAPNSPTSAPKSGARCLASPDLGDALALTFAYPVSDVPRESYASPHTGSRQVDMVPDDWEPSRD